MRYKGIDLLIDRYSKKKIQLLIAPYVKTAPNFSDLFANYGRQDPWNIFFVKGQSLNCAWLLVRAAFVYQLKFTWN